jgi:4-amino-4-deoxy-L-arabinose transferase-like glycosyltransferase
MDFLRNTPRPRLFWAIPAAALALLLNSRFFAGFVLRNPGTLTRDSLLTLAGHALDLGWASICFMGFYHYGSKILNKWVFKSEISREENATFGVLLGAGIASLLILMTGLLKWFHPPVFMALFGLLAWGAWREKSAVWKALKDLVRLLKEPVSWPVGFGALVLFAGLMRGWAASGAPPTDWDSLAYHLAFPKIYLQNGALVRLPWSENAHYPMNTEMLYTFALALRGDQAAQWINAGYAGIFLLLAGAAARRWAVQGAELLTAAILVCLPVFQKVYGNAATDFTVGSLGLAAFICYWRARDSSGDEQDRWMLASGLFSGLAMSSKISGTWVAAAIAVLEAFRMLRTRRIDGKGLALYGGAAFLLGAPWYLKNWITTGNPVWPYLGEWFGADAADLAFWHRMRDSVTVGLPKTVFNWIFLPFKMTASPEAFLYSPQFITGPAIILFAALFFRKELPAQAKRFLGASAVFMTLWFLINPDWRYCMPVIALLAVFCADAGLRLWKAGGFWRVPALALVFAFVPLKELSINNEAFAFFGVRSKLQPELSARERYLEWSLGPSYWNCRTAGAVLPPDAKVLLYRDFRGYYLDREYAWGDPLHRGVFDYSAVKDSGEILEILRRQGFTHILYNEELGGYRGDAVYYARAAALMDELLRKHARLIFKIDGYRTGIYSISSEN